MNRTAWVVLVGLTGCAWHPGSLDIHLGVGEGAVGLPAVTSHVDVRTEEGRWLRIAVREPRLPEEGEERILARAMVPAGRYTAVRIGYLVAVPRPELRSTEDADDPDVEPVPVPVDIVQQESWMVEPFCVRRGGELRLEVVGEPRAGGRRPHFRVVGMPEC